MDWQRAFGLAVREARSRRGWSQDDLAAAGGMDRAYIGGLETGRRNPALLTQARIAAALEVDLSALMTKAEELRAG